MLMLTQHKFLNGLKTLTHFIFLSFIQSLEELEGEMLNGQKLQGPHTAFQVYQLLKEKHIEKQ